MHVKANSISLWVKVIGSFILLTAMCLKGFNVWQINMQDVITTVLAMQALVLPIDVSKIKTSTADKE